MVEDSELDKARLCYNGNTKLKKAGVSLSYTQEQIQEFIRCKNDIIYFVQNYVKIISLDEGLILFDPYQYQKDLISAFKDNRFVIALQARQSGKCILGDSNITIKNKRTGEIREVAVGDFFNEQNNK